MSVATIAHSAWLESIGAAPANQHFFPVRPYNLQLFPPAGAHILDVGAHTGANLLHYARLGFACVGVEASPSCCHIFARALAQLPRLQPRPEMVCSLIEDYAPPALFGALLCGEMLCYSPHPTRVAEKLAACMRPEGVALVSVPRDPQPEFPTHLTLEGLGVLLVNAGFRLHWGRILPGLGGSPVSAVRAFRERL